MSIESFLPPFSSDRTRPSKVRRKQRGAKARARDRSRAALEALEPRTLLSTTTLPAVSVLSTPVLNSDATSAINNPFFNNPNNISDPSQNPIGNTNYNHANESSPTVVIDQADPNKMVAVWTIYDPNQESIPRGDYLHGRPLQSDVQGAYTTDGGRHWTSLAGLNVSPDTDPSVKPSSTDPDPRFTWITDADVAFDPNTETFYVTYLEHSAVNGSKAGELLLKKYDFSGGTPGTVATSTVFSWLQPDQDPFLMGIMTPTITVDGNAPSFTDPEAGTYTQTDPYSGNVYVSWVVQHALAKGGGNLKSDIQMVASDDGGRTFTDPVYLNSEALNYNANTDNYTPRIAVSQGRAAGSAAGGPAIPGGRVSVVWDANTRYTNTDAIRVNTAGGVRGADFTGQYQGTDPNDASASLYTITPNDTGGDFDVSNLGLSLTPADPSAGRYTITLTSPTGSTFVLRNTGRTNSGTYYYQPAGGLGGLEGEKLSSADISGTWTASISDGSGSPPAAFDNFSLHFVQGLDFSGQRIVATTGFRGTGFLTGSGSTPSDPLGVRPSPAIAIDNTLGAYSPYQGYMYVAFVYHDPFNNSPDALRLMRSTDGGQSWASMGSINDDDPFTDGFSAGNKLYLMPSLAVDPTTGTLVASWYDGRYDPSHARLAMMVTASNDGGRTFSPNRFVNTALTAKSGITNEDLTRGPLLDNQSGGASEDNFSYGTHQGLAVYGGQVVPVWSGNLDGNLSGGQKLDILTSQVRISAGARIVSSTMGTVGQSGDSLNSGRVTVGSPESANAAVGTPIFQKIEVQFDRPVAFNSASDPNAFDPSDVHVYYQRDTYDPATGALTGSQLVPVPVGSITALDENAVVQGEAGRFVISLAQAQTAVGVYFYTISADIKDRIRTYGYGNGPNGVGAAMDQNADGSGGTGSLDNGYSVPLPAGRSSAGSNPSTFPEGPYRSDMLPVLIPGPYITRTYTDSGSSLQKDGTVSGVYVQFDRFVDPSTFTPDQILRIMGPTGDITKSAGPYSITPVDPNADGNGGAGTFRINFSNPVKYSGTYTVQIGSVVKTKSVGTAPAYGMDTNLNAGLEVFQGGQGTSSNEPSTTVSYSAVGADGVGPVPDAATDPVTGQVTGPGIGVFSLDFAQDFLIPNPINLVNKSVLTVQFSIRTQNDHDLTAILIAPDGHWITLFNQVTATGSGANFSNTIIDDNASRTANIQNGGAPFNGRYTPGGGKPDPSILASLGLDSDDYLPSLTSLAASVAHSGGTWKLAVVDNIQNNVSAAVTDWSLSIQKPVLKSGMNEPVADQYTAAFRIFTMDPTNPLSSSTWTAVGPASDDTTNSIAATTGSQTPADEGFGGPNSLESGRITGLAFDPSDPSHNTAYVGGAGGGIWKTTNFLSPGGPIYIPLTNFGPNHAVNIGGIAVFGRNNDPNQSVIFAATGEGDANTPGAGILRSTDGGATWQVLDSTSNVDAGGNILPIDSPKRDHVLVGNSSFKVVVDPTPTPSGGIVVYVAMSGPNGGLWRSLDSGDHWSLLRAGTATDVVLDPNSGRSVTNGLLQNVWAAFAGEGVYFSSTQGTGLKLISGGVGDPLIQAITGDGIPRPLPVLNTDLIHPTGASGRIVLANPFLTGNAAHDLAYEGWLYAAVVDPSGNFAGLYQTKDFGQNWTKLRLPVLKPTNGTQMPSNDTSLGDFNVTKGTGKQNLTLAIDPQDPNIVYLGGATGVHASGLIRVDATLAADTHALVPYSATNLDGGSLLRNSTGPVSVANLNLRPTNYQPDPILRERGISGSYYYSLINNPLQPFVSNATLLVNNAYNPNNGVTSQFANDGSGVTWVPFDIYTNGATTTGQHRMVTFRDPATGYTRLVIADNQGVFTTMDDHGAQVGSIGSYPVTPSDRNGNIQITQLYYGAAQPDGSVFYGSAGSNIGGPAVYDPLGTGNILGTGLVGNASGVATDPQGLGTLYQYWNGAVVNPDGSQDTTDFFRVGGTYYDYGLGRTSGLLQNSGSGTVDPQWPLNAVVNFAVNPLSGQQFIISSTTGNIFTTQNQGLAWHQVAAFGSQSMAMAYGAPDPSVSTGLGDFLYVGTNDGKMYVSSDGGGSWTNISAGLDSSAVQSIVTNPTRGSHEAYAVTSNGVYHIADSTASGTSWTKITGNLFNLRRNVFPNSTSSVSAGTVDQNVQPYYLPVKPALASDNPGVTEMDLTISGHPGQTVGDLSVTLDSLRLSGSGAGLGDLKIVLIAPDGKTKITLFDQSGDTGTALSSTTFSDLGAALSSGQAPYTGSYKPSDGSVKLSDFTGQYIDGTWKLLVYNSNTTTKGTLGNFSLYFSSGNAQAAGALTSLAVDWRYNLPDDPAGPGTSPDQTHPALYVGGVGGVFRSFDDGRTWGLFPDGVTKVSGAANTTSANNSPLGDGGGMSSVQVSDLDMVLGKIDPTTGQADISTGPNLLLASSFGQGQFAIRLAPITLPNLIGQTPTLSIDHTDGYSDTGASSTDGITSNETPYITGYSEQTAYGNVVTVRLYDQTPNSPTFGQLVGIGRTDGFGKFRIQVLKYDAAGNLVLDAGGKPVPADLFTYNGQKILGVQATDAAGTVGNMALVGNSLSPIFLELNAPNPATIALAPGNDTGLDDDNITNPGLIVTASPEAANGQLTFDVTVDGSIQNGNITTPKVTLMRLDENGLYVPVASVNVPKTGTPNDPITVQVADPGPFQNGYAYTYAVQITDAQGNIYDPNGDPDPADLKAPHVSTVVIDATPPVPGLLQLDPDSDSGLNLDTSVTPVEPGIGDNITNPTLVDGTLVFDVQVDSADRGDTVILVRKDALGNYTVLDTSATAATGIPDPQTGKISLTLTDPGPFGPDGTVADGTYTYYLKIVDIAGNSYDPQTDPGRDTYSTSVTVDTTPPDPNSILLRLDPTSDSGTPGDDRTDPTLVTPVNRLSFDIYLDPGDRYSLVTLYRDGRAVGTTSYAEASPAVDPVTGQTKVKVVLTDPGPFTGGFPNPDGTYSYNYSVGVEDRSGNSSTGNPRKITITTVLPNQGELALDPSSDTGLSDTDNITSPALSASPSTPGTLQFHLTLDKNNSGQIANDTGATVYLLRSGDGGLTYNRIGSAVLTTKDPVSGLPVATLVDPGTGSYPFVDGASYYYQVEVINKAGIDNKEAALPVLVTIDSVTPDPASVGVVLNETSDSGLNIGVNGSTVTNGVLDGYTNPVLSVAPSQPGTVDFIVTLDPADLGSQVTLMRSSDGGKTFVAVGTPAVASQVDLNGLPFVILTDPGTFGSGGTVADGTYLYSAKVEDIAGNTDDPSKTTPQTVVVDTTPPNPAGIALASGSDTGLNTTDNITNPQLASPSGQLGFTITLDAADQNALLILYRDGVQVGSSVYATGAPANGKVTATLVDPGPFANGTYVYTVGIEDRAGNLDDAGERQALSVVINGITPSATSLTLDPGSDSADPSGRSDSDDYTNPALAPQNTGKLVFNVELAPDDDGTQVTLLRDGTPVGTPVIAKLDSSTGKVTAQVTDPTPPTTGGTYVYSVALKDSAGNLDTDNPDYTRPTLNVTIDTSAPQTPSAPVLAPGSDSGYPGYTTDNITNVNQPYFTGTAEAGDLVRIVDSTGALYGQAFADSKGVYTVQAGTRQADGSYTPLPDGKYTFYVQAYDPAGNASVQSGAGARITVNTTPITPPPTLKLVFGDDTGPGGSVSPSYFSDNVTKVTTPTLQGTGDSGRTVQIVDLGGPGFNTVPGDVGGVVTNPDGSSTILVQNGTFTFRIRQTLTDGKYKLVARTYDPATGNYSDSDPLVLTVMTGAALQAPSSFGLDPSDDTGTKGDGATSTRLYRLTGTAAPGTFVELIPDGGDVSKPIDTELVGPDGTYTLRPQAVFINGAITYRVYSVDIAGNLSREYASATIRSTTTPGDFNGDGRADVMAFNPSTGVFSLTDSDSDTTVTRGPITFQGRALSGPDMVPVEGDFNGDGRADYGVYDFGHAMYYIEESSLSGALNLVVKQYGWAGHDLPLTADFNGDGTTDLAVYRPDTATFYAQLSNSLGFHYQFGQVGDQPVVGDFNGDGKTDIAVFRPSTAQWFIQPITVGTNNEVKPIGLQTSMQFGWPGVDKAVAADFDGDGKTDIAVFRPVGSNANQTQGWFYIRSSADGRTSAQAVGTAGRVTSSAIPEALDFDGDGHADPSVYQPSSSQWTFRLSGSGSPPKAQGSAGSLPVDAPLYPYLLPASFTPPKSSGGSVGKSTRPVSGDFNGDGQADVLTFNRSNGVFSLTYSGTGNTVRLGPITFQGRALSGPDMVPVEGDFNGDGRADYGVYDFGHAMYYIEESSASGSTDLVVKQYGWAGHDLPVPADFDGDGKTDIAVYRPDTATWYAQLSSGGAIRYAFGWANHDQPVVGDFNGDGKTDIAVFRPSTAQWFIQPITVTAAGAVRSAGNQIVRQFGWPGVDKAVAADFDGDGKTDIAVYRGVGPDPTQTQGRFYVLSSATGRTSVVSVGTPGQVAPNAIPEALDFDGDGHADPSVYQPSTSQWTFRLSGSGSSSRTLGTAGSLPASAPLSPYLLPSASRLVATAGVGGMTDFEASPATATSAATTSATSGHATVNVASAPVTAPASTSTEPAGRSRTASMGAGRMTQIRRLGFARQRQAGLQQRLLARRIAQAARHQLVPGGVLALRDRWRLQGI